MNTTIRTLLATAVALLTSTAGMAQATTIAEWNFENSEDIAVTWFNQGAPSLAPDECAVEASSCTRISIGKVVRCITMPSRHWRMNLAWL